jgi:hypothetical protein
MDPNATSTALFAPMPSAIATTLDAMVHTTLWTETHRAAFASARCSPYVSIGFR